MGANGATHPDVRFQTNFVSPREAVNAAYAAISALQAFTPAVHVAGMAVAMKILKDELGLDLNQLMAQAEQHVMSDDKAWQREVQAFRDYVRGEMK